MTKIRYGTRGSALALAQSGIVARDLENATGLAVERVVITTSGDRFSRAQPSAPLAGAGAPNVKAMFVKEIEEALLAGSIDFAVHSAKDLPGKLPDGLVLAAVPPREDPRDVFLPGPGVESFAALEHESIVATGSLRRVIQLGLARPELDFASIRGNVDTRLRRLDKGEFDGMVLAAAGLRRLGLAARRHEALPASVIIPAPGQGTLAIEARADRPEALAALKTLDDERTRLELAAERALLAAMGGGCQTPLGALARVDGSTIRMEVFWSDAGGSKAVRRSSEAPAKDAVELAQRLADEVLAEFRAP